MTDAFLSLRNVSKHYGGVRALDDVNFEIRRGEIHCLVGENGSGKSTLIKIVSGVTAPDNGAVIEIDHERLHNYGSIDAIRKGIQVIYQDLSLFPNLTVAENIALPQQISAARRFVSARSAADIARAAMARVGVRLPLELPVGEISVADQQLVAICRALVHDVKLVIMDEPTASLTRKEVNALLAVVKDLQAKDIATLFVSHKLDEVLQIAERVTVLRDGLCVGVYPAADMNDETLTHLITGKALERKRYTAPVTPGQPLLTVEGLSKKGNFRDISFVLRAGEIAGITGLLGSGRSELALALFGLNRPDSGTIEFSGQTATIRSVQDAVRLGIGYVPENRLVEGLVMDQSVGRNIVLTVIDRLTGRLGLLSPQRVRGVISERVRELSIRVSSVDAPVRTLSGGNQQRVVLARWLASEPKLLILDGPTVGVDVGAKNAIHETIRALAARGIAVLMISDEIPEVYHNCGRVLVMRKGRLVAEFDTAQVTEREIQDCVYAAG